MIGFQHSPAAGHSEPPPRNRGFTLLELMVTVGVAAILLTVGVPGFVSVIQNNRATTHTNDLVTALNFARSAATQRGEAVTVCRSTDGQECDLGSDWSTGWIVIDVPDDELLRTWPTRSGGASLTGPVGAVVFQPRGSVTAAADFEIELPNCTGNQKREVEVNVAGRVSVARVAC